MDEHALHGLLIGTVDVTGSPGSSQSQISLGQILLTLASLGLVGVILIMLDLVVVVNDVCEEKWRRG